MGAIHGQGTTVTVRDNSIEQNRYKAAKLLLLAGHAAFLAVQKVPKWHSMLRAHLQSLAVSSVPY